LRTCNPAHLQSPSSAASSLQCHHALDHEGCGSGGAGGCRGSREPASTLERPSHSLRLGWTPPGRPSSDLPVARGGEPPGGAASPRRHRRSATGNKGRRGATTAEKVGTPFRSWLELGGKAEEVMPHGGGGRRISYLRQRRRLKHRQVARADGGGGGEGRERIRGLPGVGAS